MMGKPYAPLSMSQKCFFFLTKIVFSQQDTLDVHIHKLDLFHLLYPDFHIRYESK